MINEVNKFINENFEVEKFQITDFNLLPGVKF